MDSFTIQTLLDLNKRFYEQFGVEFASTRQRIQTGVKRVLSTLPDEGRWLDLGCGSGALAVEWLKLSRCSRYVGLDFSSALLTSARQSIALLPDSVEVPECSPVSFRQADLSEPGWTRGLEPGFRGALAFAVFHHLPSANLRARVLRQTRGLLGEEGLLIHSQWQFQNSPRLMERRLPWSEIGLTDDQIESGDTLLDWRLAGPAQPDRRGLRYVHLFNRAELADLAADTGYRVIDEFESDGQGGKLGLYQIWQVDER